MPPNIAKSSRRTIYTGTFIHNVSLTHVEILEDTAIGVDRDGTITFIKENVDEIDVVTVAKEHGWSEWNVIRGDKGGRGFWFPGFIDTHIHASQIPNAGIFGKSTLLSWLQTYTFPLESSFSSLSAAKRIYTRCVTRTLSHGTTTAAYFATNHVPATNVLADTCLSLGQRAFIGRCNMDSDIHPDDYKDTSVESAIEDTKATIEHVNAIDPEHKLLSPILTPRFAPSCTAALLSALGTLHQQSSLPIQTHISENTSEIDLVKSLFPGHQSYAAVYDANGLLTPKTVLAHACHLSLDEVALIRERGAKISHCPVSNSFIGSGICPVREMLDEGIDVGLGTDVSGGWSASILVAAREAGGISRLRTAISKHSIDDASKDKMKLSVEECLYLATRGGAKCLGLEKKVGGFELGMCWDAQYVDLGAVIGEDGEGGRGGVELWGNEGWEEKMAKWVFGGDERNTRAVWVGGRLVSGSMDLREGRTEK